MPVSKTLPSDTDVREWLFLRKCMAHRVFGILATRGKLLTSFHLWCTLFDWLTMPFDQTRTGKRHTPRINMCSASYQQIGLACMHIVMVENEKFYFHEKDVVALYDPSRSSEGLEFSVQHLRFFFNEFVTLTCFRVSPPITSSYVHAMLQLEDVKVKFDTVDKRGAWLTGFRSLLADISSIVTLAFEFNDKSQIYGERLAKVNNSAAAILIYTVTASIMQAYLQLSQMSPGFMYGPFRNHFPVENTKFFDYLPDGFFDTDL